MINAIRDLCLKLLAPATCCLVFCCAEGDGGHSSTAIQMVMPGIAYHPSDYLPLDDPTPSLDTIIVEDLRVLRSLGFRSLVTYSSLGALGRIPSTAREMGFDGTIIAGIWSPTNHAEMQAALDQQTMVQGYCIGNEGLNVRYSTSELLQAMAWMRSKTDLPITTSERIEHYLSGPTANLLRQRSDFIFPLAHPYWAKWIESTSAMEWLVANYDLLRHVTRKQVILKEAGYPSHCLEGCTEQAQLQFFQQLHATDLTYFVFEAYDQPWKAVPGERTSVEEHWGIMTQTRSRKLVSTWLEERYR